MAEDWRLILLKCKEELASDISFSMVAPSLIEHAILSADEYSVLSEKEGNKKQVEDLATMLATHKSEAVYLRFLDYLDTDFDWLALQLKNCTLSQEERQRFQLFISNNSKRRHIESSLENNIQQELLCKQSSSHQNHVHENGTRTNGNHKVSIEEQNALIANNPNHESSQKPTTNNQLSPYSSVVSINGANVGSNNLTLSEVSGSSHHPPCSTPSHSVQSSGTPPRHDNNSPQHHPPAASRTPSTLSVPGTASSRSIPGSSPLHSSDLSIFSASSHFSDIQPQNGCLPLDGLHDKHIAPGQNATRGTKRGYQDSDEISEEMIEYISANSLLMKKWQNLAHQTGLSSRVPVIQARIRNDGRDFDEHISEFLREWMERKPGEATVGGLIALLRKLKFNDTAMRIEDGSYKKKLKSF